MNACDYKNLVKMKQIGHQLIYLIKTTGGVKMQGRGYDYLIDASLPPSNQLEMCQLVQISIVRPGKVCLDNIRWSIAIQQIERAQEQKQVAQRKTWQKNMAGISINEVSFGYDSELIKRLLEYCSYGHSIFD